MNTKAKHLLSMLVMTAALTVNMGTSGVMAAAPESDSSTQPPQENEAPAIPESYEWEIQSNKIPGWPEGPKVIAETAILMDVDTGQILYAKGIDEKRAPASTTKIMTAMLAIEKVPFDTQITFTEEVNNIEANSTHIGIKPGETLTMKDSAYAILLASANEVSSGVAEYISGTVPAFVDLMNQRAKELGCENTNFVNANGLYDENHYTTARDLAVISRAAFQNETFREIIKTPYYIVPITNITNETRWLNNHHKMVLEGAQYYEGCLGGKTGYTEKAGNTLVTYAERNGMRLVCVVLADINAHYSDTKAIFDYGFENFQKLDPSSSALTPSSPDSFDAHLKEQGMLNTAFLNSSADVPVNATEALTYKTSLENNTLNIDYYYGDTLLGSSGQAVSQEILTAAKTFNLQERQTEQASKTISQKDTSEAESSGDSADEDSSKEFSNEFMRTFHEMPAWKYPALGLIVGAFIFYIMTLIIKLKRHARRQKRRKRREKKKNNTEKEGQTYEI